MHRTLYTHCTLLMFVLSFSVYITIHTVNAAINDTNSCHVITSTAKSTLWGKYGSPVDFSSGTPFMTVSCVEKKAMVQVVGGTQERYTYKYGYHRADGTSWKKITLSGTTTVSDWIIGTASAEFDIDSNKKEGDVLVYSCYMESGTWKCGCTDSTCTTSKWQLQTYKKTTSKPSMDTRGDGIIDVYYTSTNFGLAGEKVTLTGSGFELFPSTDILWNESVAESKLQSNDGGTLEITIPDLSPGKYAIKAREGRTVSEYGTVLWIGKNRDNTPIIERIAPETIHQGDTVTVYGKNFTAQNNDIVTTFGIMSGLKSKDGTSITFSYDPFDTKLVTYNEEGDMMPTTVPLHFTVVNTSGISNSMQFNISI